MLPGLLQQALEFRGQALYRAAKLRQRKRRCQTDVAVVIDAVPTENKMSGALAAVIP